MRSGTQIQIPQTEEELLKLCSMTDRLGFFMGTITTMAAFTGYNIGPEKFSNLEYVSEFVGGGSNHPTFQARLIKDYVSKIPKN
jgi:hypothetical protein